MVNENLRALHDAGVSIWLDDLSRARLSSGSLRELIDDCSVSGVTTNPTIFAAAFADLSVYGEALAGLKARQASVPEAIRALMATDVADACDLFESTYQASDGYDGRVSIEVDPTLAHDTEATVAQAAELRELVGKPNVLVKIPATAAGLPAVRRTIAAGISVNVTLIFSVERYREVMAAYLDGLRDAQAAGLDLSKIHSVASVFVSRIDTEVDRRLAELGTDEAKALLGTAAVANSRVAFAEYQRVFEGDDFADLAAAGANVQRALWASTGMKNPAYPDTLYVDALITAPCVNTMPESTLRAFADHGAVAGDTIRGEIDAAGEALAALEAAGIDLDDVMDTLEREGVEKFIVSWGELLDAVGAALDAA